MIEIKEVRPYKLKHKPTGLYYQPKKHRGSHFSKRGKIYQTKSNILNMGYYSDGSPREKISIWAHKDTLIYKELKNRLVWAEATWKNGEFETITLSSDWEIEEI